MKTVKTLRAYLYAVDGDGKRRLVALGEADGVRAATLHMHWLYQAAPLDPMEHLEEVRRIVSSYEPPRPTDLSEADIVRMGYSCHHVGCRRGYCRVADEGGVSTYHGVYGDGYTVRLGRHNGSTQYEDIAYYTRDGRGDLGSHIEAK